MCGKITLGTFFKLYKKVLDQRLNQKYRTHMQINVCEPHGICNKNKSQLLLRNNIQQKKLRGEWESLYMPI